jgi:hydroxymethylbilane synthase
MLSELGGGCQVPIGAFATLENTDMFLTGAVFSPDGAAMIRYTATGECTKPGELGRAVAKVLLERGARGILDASHAESDGSAGDGDGAA